LKKYKKKLKKKRSGTVGPDNPGWPT